MIFHIDFPKKEEERECTREDFGRREKEEEELGMKLRKEGQERKIKVVYMYFISSGLSFSSLCLSSEALDQ